MSTSRAVTIALGPQARGPTGKDARLLLLSEGVPRLDLA